MEKNKPVKSDLVLKMTNRTELVTLHIVALMFKKVEEGFDMLGRNMADTKEKIQFKFLEMKTKISEMKSIPDIVNSKLGTSWEKKNNKCEDIANRNCPT